MKFTPSPIVKSGHASNKPGSSSFNRGSKKGALPPITASNDSDVHSSINSPPPPVATANSEDPAKQ